MGGSDPFIVLGSADLETAVTTAVKARMLNNGQSCIAAKRFIVVAEIANRFEQKFSRKNLPLLKSLAIPMQLDTDLGPLATPNILKDLDYQVSQAVKNGAKLLMGGQKLDRPGNYFKQQCHWPKKSSFSAGLPGGMSVNIVAG